jgi:hypothetical protein
MFRKESELSVRYGKLERRLKVNVAVIPNSE